MFLNSPDPTNLDCSDSSSQQNYYNAMGNLEFSGSDNKPANLSPSQLSPEKTTASDEPRRCLTSENLMVKRDSLLLLDEEAKQNLHDEILKMQKNE